MSFFNDIAKIAGGIVSAVVPGFGALAKTGIFGNDLAALNGAPQAGPAVAAIVSSPNLLATELAAAVPERPAFVMPTITASTPRPPNPALVEQMAREQALAQQQAFGRGLSGRTVNMPVEYLTVLRDAARQASASPAFVAPGTYIPPQAATALSAGQAVTPLAALARLAPPIPAFAIQSQLSALGLF